MRMHLDHATDHALLAHENGQRISVVQEPLLLSRDVLAGISRAASLLHSAAQKFLSFAVSFPESLDEFLQPHLDFSTTIMESTGPLLFWSRFDLILTDTGPKFIELNTNCPAGAAFFARWRESVLLSAEDPRLRSQLGMFSFDDRFHFVDQLVQAAAQATGAYRPLRLALVNDNSNLSLELPYLAALFRARGHDAGIHRMSTLRHAQGRLETETGHRIDMVYCKTNPVQTISPDWRTLHPNEYRSLLDAFQDPAVVVVNPFPAITLGEDKRLLAELSKAAGSQALGLTPSERETILDSVATTYAIGSSPEPDDTWLIAHRDGLVLKPRQESRGRFVHVGATTDPAEWERLVRNARTHGGWVAQEFIRPAGCEGSRTLTCMMLHGRCEGIFGRVASSMVNNVGAGGSIQIVAAT